MQKRYEILSSLPAYGPMYVSVSDNQEPFYSEGFVVRFYKADATEWIANFQPGWTDLKQVIELEKTTNLLVVACGTCYFMNPDETKPLDVFGVDYCKIFKASNGRVVLQGQTSFTVIEPDGKYWRTQRISWDGLSEVNIVSNLLSGFAYNPMHDSDEWKHFTYDIDTKTLIGGTYHIIEKKPWWKIW